MKDILPFNILKTEGACSPKLRVISHFPNLFTKFLLLAILGVDIMSLLSLSESRTTWVLSSQRLQAPLKATHGHTRIRPEV